MRRPDSSVAARTIFQHRVVFAAYVDTRGRYPGLALSAQLEHPDAYMRLTRLLDGDERAPMPPPELKRKCVDAGEARKRRRGEQPQHVR